MTPPATDAAGQVRPVGLDRTWTGHAAATLRLAWPLVVSNLAGTALTTIDLVLIGRLGASALAAAALATNLFIAATLAGIGIVTAVAPLASAEYGRRKGPSPAFAAIVGQGFWVTAAFALLALPCLWQGERILLALGQEPDLARHAGSYLRWLMPALVPTLGFVVLRSLMASLSRPGWPLAIAVAQLPVNAALAALLIFGAEPVPAMGLPGAGLATTAAAALGFLALAVVAARERGFGPYRALSRVLRPDRRVFATLLRLGLPIGAALTFEVALFSASSLAMGLFGASALAAHSIALQVGSLCFMVPLGLSQAATVRVGHAIGAGDARAASRAGWAAIALAALVTGATAFLLVAVPGPIVSAYLDAATPGGPEVMRLAVAFLGFAALFQLVDGLQVVGAGSLRGLADTRVPMLYAALGYWGVGAPLGLLLAFRTSWREEGLWAGLAGGLAVVALLMVARWSRLSRRRVRPPLT